MRALIDTDPGIDDALALLFAWGAPELDVEAITTVAGNVPVETGTTNVFRLLALRPPKRRPVVAVGASAPLARALNTAIRYHGEDGLGDLPDWPAVTIAVDSREAATVMVETAQRADGDLTLVALGPLTNVALALRADREALRDVGRLVAMGGAVDVPGNVTPTAEFNMSVDPEAAAIVFDAGLPIDLVPLDATRQAVLVRADLEAALGRSPGPVASRIGAFTQRGFRVDTERGSKGMVLHDPLAIGVAIDASLVTWEPVKLVIGPGGETRRAPGAPNCRFARTVDSRRFLAIFLECLCRGS